MTETTRRSFLKTTLAGAGAILSSSSLSGGQSAAPARSADDQVSLGSTGVRTSFLAQGTGFKGWGRASDQTRLGQKDFTHLLRHGMDQGVNFFDMADLYGSHPYVRNALKGVPRDRYVLLSKIWVREGDLIKPSGGAVEEVDRFRKELGVDMIDCCLIHCVTNDQWPQEHLRVREELSDLKTRGVVRAVGVSCHGLSGLKVAAENPWVDLIFARINHRGRAFSMDAEVDEVVPVLKKARANGKAVVGMKLFGEGKLTAPDERDASLQYVIGNDLVDAMTIGMLTPEHVDDSIRRIGKAFQA